MDQLKTIHAKGWSFIKKYKRLVLVGIAGISYMLYGFSSSSTTTDVITAADIHKVTSGNIVNSIKVLGNTKITDQQTLTFGQEGTVEKIYVKQGQTVKKGDLLAVLDKKSLNNDMSQQSLSIQNARINYQKLFTATTAADKVKAQSAVTDIESKLTIAKRDLQDLMDEQGDTLKTNGNQAQTVIINTKSTINDSKDILDNIDEVFGFTEANKRLNNDIAIYISAKNTSLKSSTEQYFYDSNRKLSSLQNALSSIENSSTTKLTAIQSLQDKTKEFLNSLSKVAEYSANAASNSIVSENLSQSKIDGWVSSFNSAKSKVLSHLSSVNSDIKSLKNSDTDIQSKQNDIKNYEAQLIVNKEVLQDALQGPKNEDKALQSNNIKQMQISLSKLSDQSKDYEIRAPFDGNIDVVNCKKGDNITNDNVAEKSITVSNPNHYEIDMLIDQVDIVKIDKGQPVEITFDAYPGYTATGSISDIDPTPTTNAGVVSYTAKINMEKGEKKIYDSMTVTVKIITERKENVIVIPSTAIQTMNEKTAVQIMKGPNPIKKEVTIGITDGTNSEVLSGLTIGDKILLKEYKASTTKSSSSSTSSKAASTRSSTRSLEVGGGGMGGGPGF